MLKKILLLLAITFSLVFAFGTQPSFAVKTTSEANPNFGNEKEISQGLIGTKGNLYQTVQDWVAFFIKFLYFIAVVYGLWGGFNILTSSGDEKKVTTGKNIIIYAVIGIIVIFLASSIVSFVFDSIKQNSNNDIGTEIPKAG